MPRRKKLPSPSAETAEIAAALRSGGNSSNGSSHLAGALTHEALRQMADERSFEAGRQYFDAGQVSDLAEYQDAVTATVRGTHRYQVTLRAAARRGNGLDYECSCPYHEDWGAFCKHCVAVGLAWLEQAEGDDDSSNKAGAAASPDPNHPTTLEDVRAWLGRQEPAILITLLMEQALADARLRERLLLRVAAEAGGAATGPNLAAFRNAIDRALDTDRFDDGYVEYGGMRDYVRGIRQVIESIADLLNDAAHAQAALELSEYAIDAVEARLNEVDDSEGDMGGLLERLAEIHHDACALLRPNPAALAERLFEREMNGPYETFLGAVETYADVLGEAGRAAYRRLAAAEWENLPALTPPLPDEPAAAGRQRGQPRATVTGYIAPGASYDPRRFRLASILESLARAEGDVDALIAIKARDLSSAYRFLDIAQTLAEAGRRDDALAWAERGARAFVAGPDERLVDFLADEYARRGRHDEALRLRQEQFERRPGLERYQCLKEQAEAAGGWPAVRERALALLRGQTERPAHAAAAHLGGWMYRHPDRSEVVRVLLWEGEDEAAWHEAQTGGCSDDLWLRLADRRARAGHLDDALAVYQSRVEPLIEPVTNGNYDEPVRRLLIVRDLMCRLGREGEFAEYVAGLRTQFKRKRNFLKLLDANGL